MFVLIATFSWNTAPVIANPNLRYASFRDIPGITDEEIFAIESLQATRDYFTYGVLQNDEAFYNIDGDIDGFAAFFSGWLSDIFDIPFIPVILEWPELLNRLEHGSVDFTGHLTRTEERALIYEMTTEPLTKRALTIVRSSDTVSLQDIASERPLRLAFYIDTITPDLLRENSVFNGFESVYAHYPHEVSELLISGKADAFISEGAFALSFSPAFPDFHIELLKPFIFRTTSFSTRNIELSPIISAVQKALENGGMSVLAELYADGAEAFKKHRLATLLTDEEREFIANNPIISVSADGFFYPVYFYNEWEQEFQGISRDILKKITTITGLTFEISHENAARTPDEAMHMVSSGQTSMSASIIRSDSLKYEEGRYLLTTAFFSDHYAFLSRSDLPNIDITETMYRTVGLVENSDYDLIFPALFPQGLNTRYYPTVDAVIEALENGEVDLVFASLHALLRLTNFMERPGFRANMVFDDYYHISFAIDENLPLLHSIINKSLSVIDTANIQNEWMSKTFDYSVRLLESQRSFYAGILVLFTCVLILLFMLFYKTYTEKHKLNDLVLERTSALAMESAMLETVIEAIPDVLFCKDLDLKYTRLNNSFEKLFNIKRADFIGRTAADALEPALEPSEDLAKAWLQVDLNIIAQKKSNREEEILRVADGSLRNFETVKSPLLQDGKVIGILGLARDLTRHKEIEAELRRASAAKTEFIANMSHETRTPMNSIVGFSELALEHESSPKTRAYLQKIIENAHWLLHIINDILDISKIESGKIELENVPFDLGELFEQCKSTVYPKAKEKCINLSFYADPLTDDKLMIGDPYRLRQVLVNLISNAIKFTDNGFVKVTSSVVNKTENSQTILCEISDSGIGMTHDQIYRIFEPFMQADSSITRKYGGTGLGVPIVKGILDAMGGRLTIESTPGVGSTFSFELTFLTTDLTKVSAEQHTLANLEKPHFSGEILVCEDNEMNQLVISEHLRRIGLSYVIAENGQEGVNIVRNRLESGKKAFDLILMDVHMPVMDGIEAAEKIIEMAVPTPIVAITANVMSDDIEIYSKAGMIDCIGKPFMSQELWRCLLKYLDTVEAPQAPALLDTKHAGADDEFTQLLIKSFVKDNKNILNKIVDNIKSGEMLSAHRMVHTLKSSAGLIGRTRLQSAAAEIEALLKNDPEKVSEASLHILEMELSSVLDELVPTQADISHQADDYNEQKDSLLNMDELRELVSQLEAKLKIRSAESLSLLPNIRKLPEARKLAELITDYDFKPALEELSKLKITWEIE